jgi:hypothetical protein
MHATTTSQEGVVVVNRVVDIWKTAQTRER